MGIDYCAFNVLLHLLNNNKFKNVLTIGRQQIHCDFLHFKCGEYCENLFTYFGSERVDSVDASNYENCTIIHDINYPMESEIKYDLIFDGGCSEHIFNCQQSYQNYINALKIGGIYLGIIPNNNFSGHGFYQFSPEFFVQIFQKKYNAELLELYLAKVNTPMSEWIKLDNTIRYRNETKFDDTTPVYIIVIAKKCSSDGIQFTEQFPQQHNYIIDWKK